MTREQRLELALRDALDLAARALEDLDGANRSGDWTDEVTKYTAKLAELQKVLDEKPHRSTFCPQCGKHLTGGHERDGSNHCWGHDEDED